MPQRRDASSIRHPCVRRPAHDNGKPGEAKPRAYGSLLLGQPGYRMERTTLRMRRIVVQLVLAALAVLLPLAASTSAAHADSFSADFLARVNALRTAKGLHPLVLDA